MLTMKQAISAVAALGFVTVLAGSAWALNGTILAEVASGTGIAAGTDGESWDITDQGGQGSGAVLNIKLSPGVDFGINTTDANYNINTQNGAVAQAQRNEYGVNSNYAGYYMRPSAGTLAIISTAGSPVTSDFSTWTAQ